MLYTVLQRYRKLEPGSRQETVETLSQAIKCVRTRGIGERGALPKAATVAAAIAWNAGCGNSVSVLIGQFGVNNGAGVTRMADRIRTQAWLWEGGSPPLRADCTAERCAHTHTHTRGLELGLGLESGSGSGLGSGLGLGVGLGVSCVRGPATQHSLGAPKEGRTGTTRCRAARIQTWAAVRRDARRVVAGQAYVSDYTW